jgi:TolB-like protein/cytochrome c-type biogenesis protein CcmH/NrfG
VSLFAELKRRRVFRAMVGYGIAAFAVLQIIEPVIHGLHWPDAVLSYVVVGLAVGFPLVVSLAWIFDVNQGRIERTPPIAGKSGPRLALMLVGIGLLAAAPGIVWYLYLRRGHEAGGPRAERVPSIAVLPFVNLSSEKEQEYFSDGIAEEILNALAQVDGLRVIGRTSSFSMKGKGEDLRAIGEKLDAANLLEGSVRKSGTRVRITAQLIEAQRGSHLWSQEFDLQLTDVFAAQDEIAKAVVAALKLKLLPSAAIAAPRTGNPEAHDQYLLGRHFLDRGSADGYGLAVQSLERAVALDPDYAPAWAALAVASFSAADQGSVGYEPKRYMAAAQAAAEKAVALAPDFAGGYAARAGLRTSIAHDWAGARSDLERALSLSPADGVSLSSYAWLLSTLGKLPEAIATLRKATATDPLSVEGWTRLSGFYLGTGQLDLSEAAAKRALEISPEQARAARNLGFAYLLSGRHSDALAAFQRSSNPLFGGMGVALVEYELGHRDASDHALDQILSQPYAEAASYQIAQVYAWRGEADSAFEWLERAVQHRDAGLGYLKYDPFLRKVRSDPRYGALLRKLNLPAN